ncbi:FCP1-like domain, HAD-like domain protein [Artemisia annua]|uniref:FCP1-like domain, HAD-like domain protein n=1 Tax=Artemisia annua TaxID=35608 RepID=A0A2U1NYL6_ARTAN|nr:FCP1-like domain, HAD-like domain protein [Artemisia annua]
MTIDDQKTTFISITYLENCIHLVVQKSLLYLYYCDYIFEALQVLAKFIDRNGYIRGCDYTSRLILKVLVKLGAEALRHIVETAEKWVTSWKWVPEKCELDEIDPFEFISVMKGKNVGFVGDSLNENFVVSFLCVLRVADLGAKKWKRNGDLSKLNRDPSRILYISGNCLESCLQPEKCVPVKPWKCEADDTALGDLIPFLEYVARIRPADIRPVLASYQGRDIAKEFIERNKEDQSKPLVDSVELWYESLGKVLKLWVEYSWVPPRCEECKTFGHCLSECARKVNTVQTVNKDGEKVANMKNGNSGKGVKDTNALNGSTCNGVNNVNMTDGDGGWQSVVNRRNVRSMMNNTRQGSFGDYNANDAGDSNNKGKGKVNEGASGSKDVSYNENVKSKKNNSSEGKADNNGKSSASKAGNASAGDKSVVNEKVKNRTVMTKVDTGMSSASKASNVLKDNVNNGGSHSGKTVGTDKVETKNKFDILGKEMKV